jgi:hypothetical protein
MKKALGRIWTKIRTSYHTLGVGVDMLGLLEAYDEPKWTSPRLKRY